jgi:VIT1/CCC1 family predicted Fe2+/Mn2+ transporter
MSEHVEHHAAHGRNIRDIVLGMSDGLTVPFALAAGISGAGVSSHLILTAGGAELVAGAISMALGGYLSARTELDYYHAEHRREMLETHQVPHREEAEVKEVFQNFGFPQKLVDEATTVIVSDRDRWVDFMMRFELNLEKPEAQDASRSALFIGGGYAVGGAVPLFPYLIFPSVLHGLALSCVVTVAALALLGAWKAKTFHTPILRGAISSACVGAVTAAAAFGFTRLLTRL